MYLAPRPRPRREYVVRNAGQESDGSNCRWITALGYPPHPIESDNG